MRYADIKTVDIQDGTGVRVSIYVSGCHFHCKGCHNKEAWDFNYGKEFTKETIDYIIDLMNHDYIAGLSILGGEPLEIVNQKGLLPLINKVKEKYPEKNIWCYTGYRFEENVLGEMYKKYSFTREFLSKIDIMVDGEFIEEKKLTDLKFRGSTNQKKIDVKSSLKYGKAIELKFGDEARYEKETKIDNPKVMFFHEFLGSKEDKKENAEIVNNEETINKNIDVALQIDTNKNTNENNYIDIKEEKQKIAAKGIINN